MQTSNYYRRFAQPLLIAGVGYFCVTTASAQSLTGITHQSDTSYNNHTALISTRKTNPEAVLVPEIKSPAVIESRNLVYTSIGKRKLRIDAFLPAGKTNTKRIALLMIHGGGWRSGNRAQHYPLVQKLAEMGYACFTPEYRLSTEALFPAAIYDVKEAIRWIRKNAAAYQVDTAKIAIAGFSAGGQLAAFMGVTGNMPLFEGVTTGKTTSTAVQAVIDLDGVLSFVHPESGEGDDSKRTSAATYWFGYRKSEQPRLWEAASALSYAGPATPPTLFINSSVARMHAGRDAYIDILNSHHIYSEVHSFDSPHSFPQFHPWFNPMVQYMDAFLKKVFANR